MLKTGLVMMGVVLALSSCEETKYPRYDTDQDKRHTRFLECLAASPKSPLVTGGENPWNKVIDSCDAAARYSSQICVENCPVIPHRVKDAEVPTQP